MGAHDKRVIDLDFFCLIFFTIMKSLDEWRVYFEGNHVTPDLIDLALRYINNLNIQGLPVIFDFTHLARLLGVADTYLASVVNSPSDHWRSFKLRKHSGGFREISVPYPTLLYIQRWIYSNILIKISVSPYCHGFRPGRSIVTNAKWHVSRKELLKLDIADFFPSVTINRVINLFRGLGYSYDVGFYLASLCCLDGKLPQGAPTSPYISNVICKGMDSRIVKLAKRNKFNYTRYADDLTFSGEHINAGFIDLVSTIVGENGFTLNESKTRLYRSKGKRIVTGISVNDKLTVPREYKRKIKQEIYYIKKYGLLDHLKEAKIKKEKYCRSLLGRICFWLQVEPKNEFAMDAKRHMIKLMRNGFLDV